MRRYYSVRNGDGQNLAFDDFRRLAYAVYEEAGAHGYFAEAMGQSCVDGDVDGKLPSVSRALLFALRKPISWPFPQDFDGLSRDDIFDVIEFLFDHTSEPRGSDYHSYGDCGNHWKDFDQDAGREHWQKQLNSVLVDFGFELSSQGEVQEAAPRGLGSLLDQPIPEISEGDASRKVEAAIRKFRNRGATVDERRDAVKELIDIVEFFRPRLTSVLSSKDESDIFNLANNFGLRHGTKGNALAMRPTSG